MAKVSYILIPPGYEYLYARGLQSGDRFVYSRVVRTRTLLSYQKIKGLTQRSLLPTIKTAWFGLTTLQRDAWVAAASQCATTGWRLFVSDQCFRLKNGLPGSATPSTLHQYLVGNIHIESPADHVKIEQTHPWSYWVSQKVPGKKGMFVPVNVVEQLTLPLKISLNYKSNLTSTGSGSFAKFYAIIKTQYQGRTIPYELDIPLDLVSDWTSAEATLYVVQGRFTSYDLYFEIYHARGDLFVDNVLAEHSGANWCRDPFCNHFNLTFTRAFYQIPKNWAALVLPAGANYGSVYLDS